MRQLPDDALSTIGKDPLVMPNGITFFALGPIRSF